MADEKLGALNDKDGSPGMYVPLEQSPQLYLSILVRSDSEPALLHQPIRTAVKKVNPDQLLPEMKSLAQIKTESLGSSRLNTLLLGETSSAVGRASHQLRESCHERHPSPRTDRTGC